MVDAIASGASAFEEVRAGLTLARDEREAWKEELAAIEGERVIAFHPAIVEDYRTAVGALNVALANSGSPEAREQAVPRIRALIDSITVTPAASGRGVNIEIAGRLARMMELATGRSLGDRGMLTLERVKGIEPSS